MHIVGSETTLYLVLSAFMWVQGLNLPGPLASHWPLFVFVVLLFCFVFLLLLF